MSAWPAIVSFSALLAATERAARGRKDQAQVAAFWMDRERHCLALSDALQRPLDDPRSWQPGLGRLRLVRDPKPRVITVIPFVDRVVHHALFAHAAPVLDRYAIADTFACREGKGTERAIARCASFAQRFPWCWKADISKYFATIPHEGLLARLERRAVDPEVRARIARIVRAEQPGLPPGRGIPVGSLSSQHLANFYLGAFDHHVKDDLSVRGFLRYMDDVALFGERAAVLAWRDHLTRWLTEHLGLTVNPRVSRVLPCADGVPFLGWRVRPRALTPRRPCLRRYVQNARRAARRPEDEAVPRLTTWFALLAPATDDSSLRLVRAISASCTANALGAPDPNRLQPREPRRLLGQHRAERARGEPQQEDPVEPQREPGPAARSLGLRPAAARLRLGGLRRATDPVGDPCLALRRGTEDP